MITTQLSGGELVRADGTLLGYGEASSRRTVFLSCSIENKGNVFSRWPDRNQHYLVAKTFCICTCCILKGSLKTRQ